MPSLLFHAALAGLIATSLLDDEEFGRGSLAAVIGMTLFIDLDTLAGLVIPGAHRSLFHNLFFVALLGAGIYLLYRRGSPLLKRLPGGPGVAAVGFTSLVLAGLAPDLFWNGANLLYPVQDRFYEFSGQVWLSSSRGLVQDVFDFTGVGTTGTLHYATGFDPTPGKEPPGVERKFLLAGSGIQFLITVTGFGVTWARLRRTDGG